MAVFCSFLYSSCRCAVTFIRFGEGTAHLLAMPET
jgi:hypothetical protein